MLWPIPWAAARSHPKAAHSDFVIAAVMQGETSQKAELPQDCFEFAEAVSFPAEKSLRALFPALHLL